MADFFGSYLLSAMVSFASGFILSAWLVQRRAASSRTPAARLLQMCAAKARFAEEMKMSLVVRKDLKMGPGKIAAQCAHAAVAVVEEVHALRPTELDGGVTHEWVAWLDEWLATGSTKVALQCDSEESLMNLAAQAKKAALPSYVIRDAGRTQIAAGSKTVVVVGPAPKSKVDAITGDLKLL